MINIERTLPAPTSLAARKSYRNQDVVDALAIVFKGKCYLSEKVFDSINEMEIDHFLPQNERPDLVCEWSNLYAIDNKANKCRPKTIPDGGYLDPCNPEDDVEQEIIYAVEFGGTVDFEARNAANLKAVNTAELLRKVHKDLKIAVQRKHHEVVDAVAKWYTAKKTGNVEEALKQQLLLKKLLSRDSHYTMLMRSIEVVRHLPPDFFD